MFSYKSFVNAWDNFFFAPKPVEGMAVFRIIWMTMLLLYFLFDLPNMTDFYGPHAIISLASTKTQFMFPHMNIFHMLGNSYDVLYIFMGIYGLAIVSALFGFYTKTSLLVVLVCLVSLHQRNIWLLSSSELLIRASTILLLCSPCGNALSLDSFFARKEGKPLVREWAPWAVRLIQIQLSVVYLWTVWHKLKGDTWFDGTALYYATRIEAMTNFPVPVLLDSMLFIKLSTWGTLAVEVALGVLVWFKEFRRPMIIIGLIFHLGIEYMMSIPFFEIVMMALLVNYYTPEEMRAFVLQMKESFSRQIRNSTLADNFKKKILAFVEA